MQVEPQELEAVAIESKRMIEIDEFVPRKEIDDSISQIPTISFPTGTSALRPSP